MLVTLVFLLLGDALHFAPPAAAPAAHTLAKVNGVAITETHLELRAALDRLPQPLTDDLRQKTLDKLIDAELMRQLLADRKAMPDRKQVELSIARAKDRLSRRPEGAHSFPDRLIAAEVSLPLAWEKHFDRTVTAEEIRGEFEKHLARYDGTELRARQILIKTDGSPAAIEAAKKKLASIREEILAGKSTFADAARKNSDAPSREQGGDVGYFRYRGVMPTAIAEAAFTLKPKEISQPFASPFGVHILTVTDRHPGDDSLEDVRGTVLQQLSQKLWRELVEAQRRKAKIERLEARD